jgi:hypothetical protein
MPTFLSALEANFLVGKGLLADAPATERIEFKVKPGLCGELWCHFMD